MRTVTLVLLGLLLASGSAFGAALVTFDTDLEGMVADTYDAGSGVDNVTWQAGGYAATVVTTAGTTVGGPSIGMNKGTNTALAGDWLTKYGGGGTVLTLSVDVYSSVALPVFNGLTPRMISGNSDWVYDGYGAGSLAAGWTTISNTFDTAWTDAQAVAAGWRHIDYGAVPDKEFSKNVRNVGHFEVKYRVFPDFTGQLPDGSTYGYDNFNITPEPATLGVLVLAGVLSLVRRRR